MQGQSPYIINGGILYNWQKIRLQTSAMYNVIGPRIIIVGFTGYPDIVEMPRHSLDLTFTKKIGKYLEAKAGVQSLLKQDVIYLQDANEDSNYNKDDLELMRYNTGSYYTAGINIKF